MTLKRTLSLWTLNRSPSLRTLKMTLALKTLNRNLALTKNASYLAMVYEIRDSKDKFLFTFFHIKLKVYLRKCNIETWIKIAKNVFDKVRTLSIHKAYQGSSDEKRRFSKQTISFRKVAVLKN